MMESALTARDRVGVQDFVLLENYNSEAAFIENLRRRFRENLIYVIKPPVFTQYAPKHFSWCSDTYFNMLSILLIFGTDIYWLSAGVSEPLQRAGDLLQAADGTLQRGQFLRNIASHVSPSLFSDMFFFTKLLHCQFPSHQ